MVNNSMELINKIADNLYQNIASKFGEVNIADKDASSVLESEQARLFDFNFVVEGENYGAVTISIIDPKNFTVYFNEGLSGSLPESIQDRWFGFLKEMRQFAKRHMMNFDVRNIGKNQLDKRDYEAISKNSSQYTTDEITMESVSKLFGSTKTSYQTVESARIIIKHRTAVDEDKAGSRSRQIQSVYIENSAKERFKFPFKYLPGARAMARHISAGGNPHDDLGKHIIESVKEMYDLKNFVRKLQRADGFVHEDAGEVIHDAKKRYQGLKSTILTLGKTNGYKNYAENFQPTEAEFDESEIDSLKTKLVRQVDQSDLTDVLPSVLKAQRKVKEDASALNDYLSGKKKFTVKPDEEEDALIKKNLDFVKKTKQVKLAPGDHTENPIHGLIRRILVTLSKRTTDDELARAIFNIDTDFTNQRDLKLATAIASKWLKGEVEIEDFDPKFAPKKEAIDQFEDWTKSVMKEGTWHLPSDESEVKAFAQVMSKPIPVGNTDEPNTGGATDVIGKFFGDDELFDEMYVVHKNNGEEADARPAIYAWLKQAAEAGYDEPHDSILKKMVDAVKPNFDTTYKMSESEVEEGRLGFSDIEKFGKEVASKIDMEARRRGSADMEPGDADELRYKIAKEMGLVEKEDTIDEPQFEDASIDAGAIEAWYKKFNSHQSADAYDLADGFFKYHLDSGVPLDAIEKNEYEAIVKKYGEEGQMNPLAFALEKDKEIAPITNALHGEFNKIVPNPDDIEKASDMVPMESILEIDHMRKLAGVMSQTPKAKKKENIHKTTPRSIHKRQQ